MQGGDADRPIADAVDGLEELRERSVPRETDAVLDVLRGDMENVRRLVECARNWVPPGKLAELQEHMERDVRKLGDEITSVLSREIDELGQVRRPADGEPAPVTIAVATAAPEPPAEPPVIHISSTDPEHAAIRKNPPPNTIVVLDEGAVYRIDSEGRVFLMEATLVDGPPAPRNEYHQRTLPGKMEKDDAGHLKASMFGGSGDMINLTPMGRTVNRSEYKSLEMLWKQAVGQGKTVDLEVTLICDDDGTRPSWISVTYKIEGERSETVDIENVPEEDRT